MQARNDRLRADVEERAASGDLTDAEVETRRAVGDALTREILEVEAHALAMATEDQRAAYLARASARA